MKAVFSVLLAFAAVALSSASSLAQASADSPPRAIAPDPHTDSRPVSAQPDANTDSSVAPMQRQPDVRIDSTPDASAAAMDLGPDTPSLMDLGLDASLPAPAVGEEWVEHTLKSGAVVHQRSEAPKPFLTQPVDPEVLQSAAPADPRAEQLQPVDRPVRMTMPVEPPVLNTVQPVDPAFHPRRSSPPAPKS